MSNKLVLDAYDAVLNLCNKNIDSLTLAKSGAIHPNLDKALGGQLKAFSVIKEFCGHKKDFHKKEFDNLPATK